MDDTKWGFYRSVMAMKLFLTLRFVLALVFLNGLSLCWGQDLDVEDSWKGRPVVVDLNGDDFNDARRLREFERLSERAVEDAAAALIYVIDVQSPSNRKEHQRLLSKLVNLEIPTIAFVKGSAIGAGALLALTSDSIYMGSSGIVGGAGVESPDSSSEDKKEEKAHSLSQQQSILKARARSFAVKKGHRTDIAEAFIDADVVVVMGGKTVSRKGEVLTLTANEAIVEDSEGSLLAKGVVESVEELLKAEGLGSDPVRLSPRVFGETSNRARLTQATGGDGGEIGKEAKTPDSDGGVESESSLFGRREEGSYKGKIVVLKVGEDTLATGKASFEFMDRTLKKAELDGATAVVFDMDTPGGFAWYTEGLVLNSLQNISFPTYTFVNTRAESAGAIIAVGTDHIYMRPAATIGSALVVGGSGQDLAESMQDKVTQMMIGTVRNIAELKGHNPDVAEAFVTREKEVKIDGIVIHEEGNVLNLNTIRATEDIGGRPVLAKGVAQSVEDMIKAEGLQGELVNAEPLGMEAFAHWVQKLSALLIVVGIAGAYMEMNSPGFGLPGLVSVAAFSLFFFGNYLAGNLAGYELAVLLVLGLVLIGVEVFLFPGAIIPGAVGAALVMVALGMAMVDRVDLEWKWSGLPGAETWTLIFREAFLALAFGMVGALGTIFLGMRFLPQTHFGSRLILQEAVAGGASIDQPALSSGEKSYVGLMGETATDLLPSGKGNFEGRFLDIVSDGEFIGKGEEIRIVEHEGPRIVVTRV